MTSSTKIHIGLLAGRSEGRAPAYAMNGQPSQGRLAASSHLQWRGRSLYFGGLFVGEVMQWQAAPHQGHWRAWVMTSAVGAHHGWYATEQEAMWRVEAVALIATTCNVTPIR